MSLDNYLLSLKFVEGGAGKDSNFIKVDCNCGAVYSTAIKKTYDPVAKNCVIPLSDGAIAESFASCPVCKQRMSDNAKFFIMYTAGNGVAVKINKHDN